MGQRTQLKARASVNGGASVGWDKQRVRQLHIVIDTGSYNLHRVGVVIQSVDAHGFSASEMENRQAAQKVLFVYGMQYKYLLRSGEPKIR